jgi:ASC-1-like (ASCH) protein
MARYQTHPAGSRIQAMSAAAIDTEKVKILHKRVKHPWLEYLSTGDKKYELCLMRDEWAGMREGRLVKFLGTVDSMPAEILMRVTEVHEFDDFASALKELGVDNVLPGLPGDDNQLARQETGERICSRIYTRKEMAKHKIVALKVERAWNR